jgi:hypothetical protein
MHLGRRLAVGPVKQLLDARYRGIDGDRQQLKGRREPTAGPYLRAVIAILPRSPEGEEGVLSRCL